MTAELAIQIAASLGLIDLAWRGFEAIGRIFPRIGSVLAAFWAFAARHLAFRKLRERAISSRVEGVLNETSARINKFLPRGWTFRARVEWVGKAKASHLEDGHVILRVCPDADPDQTLVNALHAYYRAIIFPRNRDIIPENILEAMSLAVVRSALEDAHEYLVPVFDEKYVNTLGDDSSVLKFYADLTRLNESGLFMGPFVREVERLSSAVRFKISKESIGNCINAILQQMLSFQPISIAGGLDADQWDFSGQYTSYGFLLVSRPPETRSDIEAYVKRVSDKVSAGVESVYLLGRGEERAFVYNVAADLLAIRNLKSDDHFPLFRDYRGVRGGVGICLVIDKILGSRPINLRSVDLRSSRVLDPVRALPSVSTQSVTEAGNANSTELELLVDQIVVKKSDFDGEWINLAEIGATLRNELPDFSPIRFGFRNLYSVLKDMKSLEFKEDVTASGKVVYVRIRGGFIKIVEPEVSWSREELENQLINILGSYDKDSGWMFLGTLGGRLKAKNRSFLPQNYGFSSLHALISAMPFIELEERDGGKGKSYARLNAS